MALDTLKDTLKHELSDLLSAEKQFAKLLQQVAKNADSQTVKQMAQEHYEQTLAQQENLLKAFAAMGEKPERITCKAAQGLVEEAVSTLKEEKPKGAIKDIVILGGSLRVEHYEIAGYTHAIAAAKSLGFREVVTLLSENLKQEKETAQKIVAAAPQFLNAAPMSADSQAQGASKGGASKGGASKGGASKGAAKGGTQAASSGASKGGASKGGAAKAGASKGGAKGKAKR
jgi:ferritin-like metal-binding protein YciE